MNAHTKSSKGRLAQIIGAVVDIDGCRNFTITGNTLVLTQRPNGAALTLTRLE